MGRRERVFLPEMDATLRRHYFLSDILRWLFYGRGELMPAARARLVASCQKAEGGTKLFRGVACRRFLSPFRLPAP